MGAMTVHQYRFLNVKGLLGPSIYFAIDPSVRLPRRGPTPAGGGNEALTSIAAMGVTACRWATLRRH
jgi:hypothetical protein